MLRLLRFKLPSTLYRLTSHRDGRVAICLSIMFQGTFPSVLAHVFSRFNYYFHSCCLMSNHYPLRFNTPNAYRSQVMRQSNGVFTQRFNRHANLIDHVLQGRYQLIMVVKAAYLLELSRYIVLIIIRLPIIQSVGDWRWNRYHFTTELTVLPVR